MDNKSQILDLPPTPATYSKFNKAQFILFIIMTLVSFATIGVLYYQNSQLKQEILQIETKLTPIPKSITSIPTTDLTLRWETYRNEKFKYEITYPKGLLSNRLYFDPFNGDVKSETPINQSDDICFNVEGPGVDTCLEVKSQSFDSKLTELKTYYPIEQSITNENINHISWTHFVGRSEDPPFRTSVYITEKNGFLYAITFVIEDTSEKMMSSFKFLD